MQDPQLGPLTYTNGLPYLPLLPNIPTIGIWRDCPPTDQRSAVLKDTAICDAGAYQTNAILTSGQ